MTSSQKALKLCSFAVLIMCIVLAIVDSSTFAFANTSSGLLQAILIGAAAVLNIAIGVLGIGAANKPVRAQGLFMWGSLVAVLNIVFAVVLVMMPGVWYANVINCVVVCLYWHNLRIVRVESLR